MEQNDVLVELSTEDIGILSHFYSKRQDVASYIYSYLENAISWSKNVNSQNVIQVFVPAGDEWKETGTFVSVGHFAWNMIVVFTMEDSCGELCTVLSKTKRFDFKAHTYLYFALHEKLFNVVEKAMAQRGLIKTSEPSENVTDLWTLKKENAVLLVPSFPDEYVLSPLRVEDATTINDLWPHKGDNSLDYVRVLIEFNGGWGLYSKRNKQLVGWILKSQLGQLALLQVDEAHQRKGLARALISALSRDIAKEGFDVHATIVITNIASQTLFAKCGFEKKCLCSFCVYK